MLEFVLAYFIGKYFFDFAQMNNRSAWGFAILGVATYYGAQILTVMVLGLVNGVDYEGNINGLGFGGLILVGLGSGLAGVVILYQILKYAWKNKKSESFDELLDDNYL